MHIIVPDCWKPSYKQKCLEILQLERLQKEEFNKNNRFINLKNGLFDLKEYKVIAHTPEFLSTIQLPILYDKNAECPNFIKFLHEIFEDDETRIKLIQQLFGYCLTSSTKAQKAFILQGSGANGKSVLLSILTALVCWRRPWAPPWGRCAWTWPSPPSSRRRTLRSPTRRLSICTNISL